MQERGNHLPIMCVLEPNYHGARYGRVRRQPFFDLQRVYVLAA